MTAVRTDLMTWPQLLPFRQPMLARFLSRDFVVPFLISVVIHAFLVFLLGVVDTDRTEFEPTAPSIDTHMIVSLTTFDTASQNELDSEAVSVVTNTGPPDESKAEAESLVESKSQTIPSLEAPDGKSLVSDVTPLIDLEAISRIDLEFGRTSELELESLATSIDLGIPGLGVPDGKSFTTDETPLIDLEAISRIDLEFGGTSEFEFETFVTSIDLGIPGLEAPNGKSFTTLATPSIDLESNLMQCIDREGTWVPCIAWEGAYMSKSEVLMERYEYSMFIIERNRALLPPDCRTAYANIGIFGIPLLIRDAITGDGCKW